MTLWPDIWAFIDNFVGTIRLVFGYTLTSISKSDRHNNGSVAEKIKVWVPCRALPVTPII